MIKQSNKKLLSVLDVNFDNPKEIMNSPRSLKACRQLGIIPSELYFQDFETYVKLNPEVIGLPKDIQKIRFDNIDNYRKETIEMVKEQREKIINTLEEKKQQFESTNISKINNATATKMNTNINTNTNDNSNPENNLYNLDEQLNNMIEKEKKNLEILKRRQKN